VVVRETGLGWEEYVESIREQIVIRKYIQKEKQELIASVEQPAETEINDQYRINATSFTNPELIRFSEIFIDTGNLSSAEKQKAKDRVESIYRDYENGEGTFSELVLKHSDDTKARYNDGDKGFFARNDPRIQTYGSSFFNKIFALDIDSVSKVLESNVGYHIVKITDHRDAKILKLDDPINPNESMTVRQYIQTLLMQEKNARVFQLALQELVIELKEKAEIRIFEDNIK
jgi:peptidyl-prolyl cis-trans isomerase SurA